MQEMMRRFVQRVDAQKLPVDAVELYRGDKLVCAHRWTEDVPHVIYSQTKSFLCAGIGMAVEEGLLSLEDTLAQHFPQYMTPQNEKTMQSIQLRHLLTMSSGFGLSLLMGADRQAGKPGNDFIAHVLSHPLRYAPGEAFCYSNGDSYLAGRMLENATGVPLRDFLNERLFKPLEIPCPQWEQCPQGHYFGASGILMRTSDMAKLGLLFLHGGKVGERQVLSPAWIAEASACHIRTGSDKPWDAGYGYQIWRMENYEDAYRFDGACGQITLVMPRQDAVICLNCTALDVHPVREAVDEELAGPIAR